MSSEAWGPFFAGFWVRRHLLALKEPQDKLIMAFLATHYPDGGGRSGIYKLQPAEVAFGTALEERDVALRLARGFPRITWDAEAGTAFVHDRLAERARLGGKPHLILATIWKDFQATWASTACWLAFGAIYPGYVERSPQLSRALRLLREGSTEGLFRAPRPDVDPTDEEGAHARDEVETALRRYVEDLDQEDAACTLRVMRHLMTNRASGKPISLGRQLDVARRAATHPALKIARAAYVFESTGAVAAGKKDDYFFGIVRGSASEWYSQRKALDDKAAFDFIGKDGA